MNCREALESILEADPGLLTAQDGHPLSVHLEGCARCRAAAETVLREQIALGNALEAAVPDPDLEAVLDLAIALPQEDPASSQKRTRVGRWWKWTPLPLAAAAAGVALLIPGEAPMPGAPYQPPRLAEGLELEVPDGTNVAVFETNNPDITVLWFF